MSEKIWELVRLNETREWEKNGTWNTLFTWPHYISQLKNWNWWFCSRWDVPTDQNSIPVSINHAKVVQNIYLNLPRNYSIYILKRPFYGHATSFIQFTLFWLSNGFLKMKHTQKRRKTQTDTTIGIRFSIIVMVIVIAWYESHPLRCKNNNNINMAQQFTYSYNFLVSN